MTFLTQHRVRIVYLGAIATLVGLLFVVGVLGFRQHITIREAVNRIDHTGHLRMLGQRVVQKMILIRNGPVAPELNSQLDAASKQFETTLSGLKNGNADLMLYPTTDPDTLSAIASVEIRWRAVSGHSPGRAPAADDFQTAQLTARGDQLLQACEQLMVIERRRLVVGQANMLWTLSACMVALLLLGTITLWLLRRQQEIHVAEEIARTSVDLLAATRESEARLKMLMASSLDPLLTINIRGIVQTASDSVETVLGWPPQELIGQNVNVLMPEPYHSEHDGYLARYQRTGVSSVLGQRLELPALRRDGTVIPAVVTFWQVPDQSEPLFVGIISDITLRKRAEAELGRFRAALDASPDAVFLIDRERMQFVDMNKTACADMGYSRDELLAMGPHDVEPKLTRQEVARKFDEIIETEEQVGVIETVHRRKDGSTFPVEVFLRALKTDSGTILIAAVRDISERKRAEGQLESLNRQLVAAARQAGKAEIAASVLHNVGNVLNSVNTSAGLVDNKLRRLGISDLNKAAAIMEQHLDDLGAYVTQDARGKHLPEFLICLSRRMAGEEATIREEVNALIRNIDHINAVVAAQQSYATGIFGVIEEVSLVEIIEEAIRINMASMKRHSIEVMRQLDDVGPVLLDKERLLQIMVNLIGNGKNACLESGNKSGRLTVSLRRGGQDRVLIEVRDNGIGIRTENLTRIFAHGFTTRKEGHGFGLHSAALAAKELGGSLTVSSDGPGTGAAFTLDLPYKVAEVALCAT